MAVNANQQGYGPTFTGAVIVIGWMHTETKNAVSNDNGFTNRLRIWCFGILQNLIITLFYTNNTHLLGLYSVRAAEAPITGAVRGIPGLSSVLLGVYAGATRILLVCLGKNSYSYFLLPSRFIVQILYTNLNELKLSCFFSFFSA